MAGQPMTGNAAVADFFNRVSTRYDETIRRTIPPYQEMFEAVVSYAFVDFQAPLKILELGCGTGNLSVFVGSLFPKSTLTLVDLSPEMLQQAAAKLSEQGTAFETVEGGFMELDFPDGAFDLVLSSVALHHLTDAEKPGMYQRIYRWLKPGGLLRIADEVKTLPTPQAMDFNEQRWIAWAKQGGATDEEIAFWQDHAIKYDHYSCLHDHFRWMDAAGFQQVDCYWKRVFWSVFGGQKPF